MKATSRRFTALTYEQMGIGINRLKLPEDAKFQREWLILKKNQENFDDLRLSKYFDFSKNIQINKSKTGRTTYSQVLQNSEFHFGFDEFSNPIKAVSYSFVQKGYGRTLEKQNTFMGKFLKWFDSFNFSLKQKAGLINKETRRFIIAMHPQDEPVKIPNYIRRANTYIKKEI